MDILTINAGSSSLKCALFDLDQTDLAHPLAPRWEAQADWERQAGTARVHISDGAGQTHEETLPASAHAAVLDQLLPRLWEGADAPLSRPGDVAAVGQRVVHGGPELRQPTIITPAVRQTIADLAEFAPLHNPLAVACIDAVEQRLPGVTQVGVFDTAFHHTLPPEDAIYPGPYAWAERGIRRYGFHGINVEYCVARAGQLLARDAAGSTPLQDLVVGHLGNGASLTAVHAGASVATTMGFTPLDGLMMGTRSGSVDPSILIYLLRQGQTVEDLDRTLNSGSGLLGISGTTSDMRALHAAIARGDERAALAYAIYLHRLNGEIARMVAALGRLDGLIFTGGIGEHDADLRSRVGAALAFLGVQIDGARNSTVTEGDIAADGASVRTLIIPANEAWAIACACATTLGNA